MELNDSINDQNSELYNKLRAAGAIIDFGVDETATSWYVQEVVSYKNWCA